MINDTLLPIAAARIDRMRADNSDPDAIVRSLEEAFGAVAQYQHGEFELSILGLKVSVGASWSAAIGAWRDRAQRHLVDQALAS